jgi:hypothetical protein
MPAGEDYMTYSLLMHHTRTRSGICPHRSHKLPTFFMGAGTLWVWPGALWASRPGSGCPLGEGRGRPSARGLGARGPQ